MSANEASPPKTVFFKRCVGAFQGGGCRIPALVGAYQAAARCGIHFAEVAGTSAGSIIAAFIGAGASPDDIVKILDGTKFVDFLKAPEKENSSKNVLLKFVTFVLRKIGYEKTARLLRWDGLYSSSYIEEWLDGELAKLLNLKRPVVFDDLPISTYIVATDLLSSKLQVWSKDNTPDESVAFAVRASCSMPLFFQAVRKGLSRYVDGGVLCNLPSFVFSSGGRQPLVDRILSFQLISDFTPPASWTIKELCTRVVDTVVDGSTELQQGLQPESHSILIPTGTIHATDFERMDKKTILKLMQAGQEAVEDFVRRESMIVKATWKTCSECYDLDQVYNIVAEHAEVASDQVIISCANTDWAWKLFPTLLFWRLKGIPINVLAEPIRGNEREQKFERFRRDILIGMGATFKQVNHIPLEGFILLGEDKDQGAMVLLTGSSPGNNRPVGIGYVGVYHRDIIRLVADQLTKVSRFHMTTREKFVPTIVPYSEETLFTTLKTGVHQYKPNGVQISFEEVALNKCLLVANYAREYKLRQAERTLQIYKEAGYRLFDSIAVKLRGGKDSVVTPPVLEELNGEFICIEGHTRLVNCFLNNIKTIRSIIVRNVECPLPGKPIRLSHARVVSKHLPPEERMIGLNYTLFRHIETAVHCP